MPAPYLIGLDIGQVSDPSALAITQRRLVSFGAEQRQEYQVRHLERFPLGLAYVGLCEHGVLWRQLCAACPGGTSIGGMVERVRRRLLALPLPHPGRLAAVPVLRDDLPEATAQVSGPQFHLLIDATGCGRPVADLFGALAVWPILVTMTHGHQVTEHDRDVYSVPKPVLVGALQVGLQEQRVKVAAGLPEAATLVREAQNFQYKLTPRTGDDTYGAWRTGTHDDLLFAVALTVWHGEYHAPLALRTGATAPSRYATATGHPFRRARR